jgi:hypothetical protein
MSIEAQSRGSPNDLGRYVSCAVLKVPGSGYGQKQAALGRSGIIHCLTNCTECTPRSRRAVVSEKSKPGSEGSGYGGQYQYLARNMIIHNTAPLKSNESQG